MNKDLMNKYYFFGFYIFLVFGTLYLFIMNYYHDYFEYKLYTLEQRIFLMNYNNFHYEHGIWLSLYAISSIFFILFVVPEFFKENLHLKEKLKEKIKEGINEFNHNNE